MNKLNYMKVELIANSCNEALARTIVSAMAIEIDPTIEELADLKTVVSEAITNCIIHGYKSKSYNSNGEPNIILLECTLYEDYIELHITDYGVGIEDLAKAMEPFYSSAPEMERSGMGFSIMQAFCREFNVVSEPGKGTSIRMTKHFREESEDERDVGCSTSR